jgi:ATP-dependent Clp protease ATP-binding subunit ClpA
MVAVRVFVAGRARRLGSSYSMAGHAGEVNFESQGEVMYERFTDRARKVCQLANQEAQRLNHDTVGSDHLLLGIVKEGSGIGAHSLKELGLDVAKIRLAIEAINPPGADMVMMGKVPQNPSASSMLAHAIKEAREMNHDYVGTEHLLLGASAEKDGPAAAVFDRLSIKPEVIRGEVLRLMLPAEVMKNEGAEKLMAYLQHGAALQKIIDLQTRTNELLEILVKQSETQRA